MSLLTMTAVLYPVAKNAEAALNAPVGRAARAREAQTRAKAEVRFVTEAAGPGFDRREAALAAWRGRLDDEGVFVQPEDRFCTLREVLAVTRGRRPVPAPVEPLMKDGRRWPQPKTKPKTVWRLSVSYWKLVDPGEAAALGQARAARKAKESSELEPDQLRALTRQPLQPTRPQRALDIGLFEAQRPEAPGEIMPDE
jgi:hypothetical protein